MSDPFVFLNSINESKQNLIRDSGSQEAAEKMYNPFLTNRMLGAHLDCVFFVDELNQRGLVDFGVTKQMHYEFLLELIPRGRRFTKRPKPEKDEKIELIIEHLRYSRDRAVEVVDFFTDEDFDKMKNAKGGRA